MKSALGVVRDIRKLLLPLEPNLGGKIYQFNRAKNSVKNDIVINVLGASNEYMQFAIVNVNIHVPNMQITLPNNGGTDDTQPNLAVIDTLVSLIAPRLETHVESDYRTNIRNHSGMVRDNDGSWYYNLQVNYWSMQIDYRNI